MWSLVFPAATECVGLDLDRLARFALTGGSIHNVALNSAFLSAHAGEPVMMPRVLDAMRAEYRKLARPVSESDFRALVAEGGGSARA